MMNMPFDEGTGDTANDSSAYGNNGTLISNPVWTTGQVGTALQFDGNDTYVEVSDDYSMDITDEITLEAWVNINDFSSAGYLMAKNYGSLDEMTYAVYIQTDERLHIVLDDIMWDTGYVVPIGQWKHLVVTWDGTTVRLYVDGIENWSDSHAGSLTPNDRTLVVGARNNTTSGTSYHFDGIIDELRIHERALLADEIQARYDETK